MNRKDVERIDNPTVQALLSDMDKAREALQYVRHRDSCWHDDDVVTPALAATERWKK